MWNNLKIYIFCIFLITEGGFSICEEIIENEKEKSTTPPEFDSHVLKRYDQEYQACLENFDIHKDKIIRTQDSREMGAKYINEFDLGSRDECLRACCGIDSCDVFVFEEKNPGSCYLFHCGPPDDFKCKFTKHHNYTSAVMVPNRHLSELENQIKLTKHEQELTQLRKSEATAQSTGTPFVSTTIVVPEPPKEPLHMQLRASIASSNATNIVHIPTSDAVDQGFETHRDIKSPTPREDRHCSVYQFECQNSGECIAIYNACDGIPQCADGSDEAQELNCPVQGTTVPSSPATSTHPAILPQSVSRVLPVADSLPSSSKYSPMKEEVPMGPVNMQLSNEPSVPLEGQQGPPGYNHGGLGTQYKQQDPQDWQQPPQPLAKPPLQQRYPVLQQSSMQNVGNQEKTFMPGLNQQPPEKMYGMEAENQPSFNVPWANYQHSSTGQYQGPPNHQYEDGNSHIFNHKGNGLVADSDSPPGQFNDNAHDFNAKFGGNNGGNVYYNNAPYRPVPPNGWQPNQQQSHDTNQMSNSGGSQHNGNNHKAMQTPDYYYEDGQSPINRDMRPHGQGIHDLEFSDPGSHHQEERPYPHQVPQKSNADQPPYPIMREQQPRQRPEPSLEVKMEHDIGSIPTQPKVKIEVHNVKVDKPIVHQNHEVTTSGNRPKVNENVKKRVDKKEKVEERVVQEENVIVEVLDGDVPKPTGAILSLALGLCITGILVTLVGCRVRVIRKRLRRGSKSPYAHDADYLVNGMYL